KVLRRIEACCFGSMVGAIAGMRFDYLTGINATLFADPAHLRTHIEFATLISNLAWYMSIAIYGLFIPNTWRRCALVIPSMAVIMLGVTVVAAWVNPVIAPRLPFMLGASCIGIFMVGGLALYGTFKISTLQAEAFAARQLGQYQLRQKLGAGGMGEVYLAEH